MTERGNGRCFLKRDKHGLFEVSQSIGARDRRLGDAPQAFASRFAPPCCAVVVLATPAPRALSAKRIVVAEPSTQIANPNYMLYQTPLAKATISRPEFHGGQGGIPDADIIRLVA